MIELTTGIVFLLSSMYGAGASADATTTQPIYGPEKPALVDGTDRKAIEKYLREHYSDTPILVEIAQCESMFGQLDKKGNVIRGIVNRADVGVMQINETYHLETAQKLGYDIHTVEGNVAYAQYLYKKFGSSPWSASKPCWGSKVVAMK